VSTDREKMSTPKTLSHKDYTVAWICALPLEKAAALATLDEEHPRLRQDPNDQNNYTLAEVCGHNVVLACLPAGVYGTISAATIAVQIRFTFPSIRFALMVGIAGGVPNQKSDIRLGDVVVSKPTLTSGGVMQYDYGNTISGGRFERVGVLDKPPQVLLTAIANLESSYMVGKGRLYGIVSDTLECNPRMKSNFAKPDGHQDQRFRADYDHIGSEDTCALCASDQLVSRRQRLLDEPHVHYGLIASGNRVMKDGRTRDRIAKQLPILCFEMEAAGLMDQIPSLVIRGICDYSDSHKNKEWQGYAALTAAAYAKELLSITPTDQNGKRETSKGNYLFSSAGLS
jgi:nucleoside phosphorylase